MGRWLQIVIAMTGLFISGLLGWLGWQAEQARNQQETLQTYTAQTALFAEVVGQSLARCDNATILVAQDAAIALNNLEIDFLVDERMAGRGVLQKLQFFNNDAMRSRFRRAIANDPDYIPKWLDRYSEIEGTLKGCVAEDGGEDAANEAPAADLSDAESPRGSESTSTPPPPPPAPSKNAIQKSDTYAVRETQTSEKAVEQGVVVNSDRYRWQAVLASYKIGTEERFAVERFQLLQKQTAGALPPGVELKIYRTQISKHYALTLFAADDPYSSGTARELVSDARANRWSPDSFLQRERTWIDCSNSAGSIASLGSC
ncbi:MAG: hypothetical protein AAFQ67_04335 [Pseudomonadota bacterium]